MRMKLLLSSQIFVLSLVVSCCLPPEGSCQIKESDKQRLDLYPAGAGQLIEHEAGNIFTDKEMKYVAGEDKIWFTDDDAIYHYFLIDYDADGNLLRRECKNAGDDTVPLTSDDILLNYQVFEYGDDGKVKKEVSFDGNGKEQYWVSDVYDENGRKSKVVRYGKKNKEIRSMELFYDESGRLIRDVEYDPDEIEKYHRFYYDESGKLVRVEECHVKEEGKGSDDEWFTDDDVVSSTKVMIYDEQGKKNKEHKFIGSGEDGEWFTNDDVMQYYVIFEYQKRFDD